MIEIDDYVNLSIQCPLARFTILQDSCRSVILLYIPILSGHVRPV